MATVSILGIDGYLGWTLAMTLAMDGYKVHGCDNYLRRRLVKKVGSDSIIPIRSMETRIKQANKRGLEITFTQGDITNQNFIENFLSITKAETIVHFAEMPSAPYSMCGVEECIFTHRNNIEGTLRLLFAMKKICPDSHLVKLGTMGEYGTPDTTIPENSLFVKDPGSFYHATKCNDSINIGLACKIWDLTCTDIMQGIVYGIGIDDPILATRFDYDEAFGTVINRFCASAIINHPLTLYGKGKQKRGFLSIVDSMNCLRLIIKNPPNDGNYRVINQFEEIYPLEFLAEVVKRVATEMFNMQVEIRSIKNPRIEREEHEYFVEQNILKSLGFVSEADLFSEVEKTLKILDKNKNRINRDLIIPKIKW